MEPIYVVALLMLGALIDRLAHKAFPKCQTTPKKPETDYQTQLDSLRTALNATNTELATKSPLKISRVDNKELFDRIDAIEKAEKVSSVIRHEHFYMELPKPAKKGLGKGVTSLFPETEV